MVKSDVTCWYLYSYHSRFWQFWRLIVVYKSTIHWLEMLTKLLWNVDILSHITASFDERYELRFLHGSAFISLITEELWFSSKWLWNVLVFILNSIIISYHSQLCMSTAISTIYIFFCSNYHNVVHIYIKIFFFIINYF